VQPETKFAYLGGDRIAYQVLGEGPDLLFVSGLASQVDLRWEDPSYAAFLRRLASFSRLILFDRRGTGASDRPLLGDLPPWEDWSDDVRAVLDAVGSERTAILAQLDAGPMAIMFAATEPDRTSALILFNTVARFVESDDYPLGARPSELTGLMAEMAKTWGTEEFSALGYPSMADDARFLRWSAKYQRASCTMRDFMQNLVIQSHIDVRPVLSSIVVPTLVMNREHHAAFAGEQGRYVADRIPGARFIAVSGQDSGIFTETGDAILDQIEEFLTGVRRGAEIDRVLATVMFTDIVRSTDLAARLGDRKWREFLGAHDDLTKTHVSSFHGRVIKGTGDGALATFEGPGRALRCAFALTDALRELGLDIRVGLHVGEVELGRDGDVDGISVHIAARVMSEAQPGEVLVSRTVKDLVAGSTFEFAERGERQLKGVPGSWALFAAKPVYGEARSSTRGERP
jgi:class 3 adenylate cyclase